MKLMNNSKTYNSYLKYFEYSFHLEISGKNDIDEHSKNILLIFLTFSVFHLEISGKADNNEQLENIELIFVTF